MQSSKTLRRFRAHSARLWAATTNVAVPTLAQTYIPSRPSCTTEALESRTLFAASITGLTLIDAGSNKPLYTLTEGATINLAQLQDRSISVRADVGSGTKSVKFGFDANASYRVEGVAPFALAGDNYKGDYYGLRPTVGKHTVSAIAYGGDNATGAASAKKTINFTVVDSSATPPASPVAAKVNSLTLVDAKTDKDLYTLTNGATIDLAKLANRQLNVRANVTSGVKSVKFGYDANASYKIESAAPFALASNDGPTGYYDWTPTVGSHSVTATGFSGVGATGTASAALKIAFTVIDTKVATTPAPTPTPPATPTSDGWVRVTKSNADASAPQLVLQLLGEKIVAGQQVQVNATSSTIRTGSPLTAKYTWTFGDANGKYNTLRGWNAAHAYEAAGTYTVTLTVTDESGRSTTVGTTVKVSGDSRKAIYVAANGNDANDGSTAEKAIKSIDRLNKLITHDRKVLFRRGDKFNTTVAVGINHKNVTVGAYGTGANPILNRLEGNGAGIISIYIDAVNTVVRDITFDSPNVAVNNVANKINVHAVYAGGINVSVRDCTFLNVDYAINAFRAPKGLLVQGCKAPLLTGVRGYLVWGEGSDHVYMGNSMANSTREHAIRVTGMTRLMVYDNDLSNPDRSNVDPADGSKGTIEVHAGSWAYVTGNRVSHGALRVGPRGGSGEAADSSTEWVVIERNEVTDVAIRLVPGSHHVFVRNNVIREPGGGAAIEIVASDESSRSVQNVVIANNTGNNPASGGKFLRLEGRGQRITLVNNMYVMPKMFTGDGTGSLYIAANDLASFSKIANNVWQKPAQILRWANGGVNWVRQSFDDSSGYKDPTEWEAYAQVQNDTFANVAISGWTPSTSSIAANFGVAVKGVFEDFYGKSRASSGAVTAGAVEV